MTTVSDAHVVLRAVLEAAVPAVHGSPLNLRWYGDRKTALPNTPAPFAFMFFNAARSSTIENGRGRGHNRHRNQGIMVAYVFIPQGWTLKIATDAAEAIATLYRPLNQSGVIVDTATVFPGGEGSQVRPPGVESDVANYLWAACEVEFHHDQLG